MKVSQKRPRMIPLYEMSRIGESIETESGLVVARGWGVWGQARSDSLWIGCLWGVGMNYFFNYQTDDFTVINVLKPLNYGFYYNLFTFYLFIYYFWLG